MLRFLGIVLAIALFVLAALNPGMGAFETYVENQSEQIIRQETGDSPLGRALSGAGAGLAGAFAQKFADRNNYLIFSTYTLDIDRDGTADRKFLGIARQFFELDAEDA
jgi:hypothetical protein